MKPSGILPLALLASLAPAQAGRADDNNTHFRWEHPDVVTCRSEKLYDQVINPNEETRDFDLMPDWWAIDFTESIDVLGIGRIQVGDPVPDHEEYLHGTDPTDPDSYLKMTVKPGAGGPSFRHSTVPGRDSRDLIPQRRGHLLGDGGEVPLRQAGSLDETQSGW